MANPRIIAGKAKGLRLKSVPGTITRPITDRVKESLFNIIGADIVASDFLDLFAGTGSVGIEALSRDADYVQFVEINPKAFEVLKFNLKKSKFIDQADMYLGDAFTYIGKETTQKFDYLYIAPPQYHQLWSKMLQEIDANTQHLHENAWVIAQIDPVEYEPQSLRNLTEFDQRKYGNTLLIFYIFSRFS